jgi:hypothetical protein
MMSGSSVRSISDLGGALDASRLFSILEFLGLSLFILMITSQVNCGQISEAQAAKKHS